jgi:magnesium-transporting ATPase (P-type)
MSEAALVVAAAKCIGAYDPNCKLDILQAVKGVDVHALYVDEAALEIPFSSKRKMKATFHRIPTGEDTSFGLPVPSGATHMVVVKGAPDRLLPHCIDSLEQHSAQGIMAANEQYAVRALHVLVTAAAALSAEAMEVLRGIEDSEVRLSRVLAGGLDFLGLVGLRDPPREGVLEAVLRCHGAAVRVVIITGDQISTARAISKNLVRTAITCGDMHLDPADPANSELMPNSVLDGITCDVNCFARAQPMDKIAIVESLQRQRKVTVMTGDGVNDAAALKAADIGVAMGISGTEVAKGAADLILTDDNFSSIVQAVQEGRRILDNLQKYVLFYLDTMNL